LFDSHFKEANYYIFPLGVCINRDGTPLATQHATLNLESNGVHDTPQIESIDSTNKSHTEERQQHTNKLTILTVTKNTPVTLIYQDSKYSKKKTDPSSVELISIACIFPPEDGRTTETCSG
jgi:hypothetical protein